MSNISIFIQKYYPNEADTIWQQLLQYKTQTEIFNLSLAWNAVNKESSPELCKVASRILTIPSFSAAAERNLSNFFYIHDKKRKSSDITEAVERFNNRPSSENNQFELLDPSSDDSDDKKSSRNELRRCESE
ncbi:10708_t:CDS:2 [Gigaspora rosea]|nr:10708_t:CDS:2 [Gigaspora rosea]